MSFGMNRVQLIGRLGADVTVNHLTSGGRVANLSIATDESYIDRNGTGERVDKNRVAPGRDLPGRPHRHAGAQREEGAAWSTPRASSRPGAGRSPARTPTASRPRFWSYPATRCNSSTSRTARTGTAPRPRLPRPPSRRRTASRCRPAVPRRRSTRWTTICRSDSVLSSSLQLGRPLRRSPLFWSRLRARSRPGLAPALRAARRLSAPAGGRGWPVSGCRFPGPRSLPCRNRTSPPGPRRERGRRRRRAQSPRRSRLPPVPPPRPPPQGRYWVAGDLDGARRALALCAARTARHAGQVDGCGRGDARRSPRHRPAPHGRADAARGARRGARLPRPAGCAGNGRVRKLRRDGSGATPVAALPRHRRHACGALPARLGSRALPLRGAALPPRASLSRRLVGAPPAGAGRRRVRRRRRRHRRAAHMARPPLARPGGRRGAEEGARARLRTRRPASAAPPTELRSSSARASRRCCRCVTAAPEVTAAAALSAGSLGAFAPPSGVARLVIARDNDPEGEQAAERLARRCARARVAATVIVPEGGDFNDDLVALGPLALAARARAPVSPAWPGAGVKRLSGGRRSGRGSSAAVINGSNRHVSYHLPARRRRRSPHPR